jgi:hypothetical protein
VQGVAFCANALFYAKPVQAALHEKSDFSVQPRCSPCLVVVFSNNSLTTEHREHRDCTEKSPIRTFLSCVREGIRQPYHRVDQPEANCLFHSSRPISAPVATHNGRNGGKCGLPRGCLLLRRCNQSSSRDDSSARRTRSKSSFAQIEMFCRP